MGTGQQMHELLAAVAAASPNIDALCLDVGLSQADTCDLVARMAATSYLHGSISWEIGDLAMVHLFSWAYRDGGPGLSDFAWMVYSAFTLGESRHPGQPDNAGAEYFAVPLLRLACGRSPGVSTPLVH